MRRRLLVLAVAAMMAFMPLVAQHAHCNEQQCCNKTTEQLTGDDAVAWAKQHVGRLIDNYLATAGNKLDPDELRKQLAPIGYDGTNVPEYRAAEKWLVDTVYRRMMQRAIMEGNSSITVLTGPGGAGKSTATKNIDFSGEGVLYDSALNSYESLKKVVDKAINAGMNDIKVIAFYNDIETCYKNSIKRGKATNRFLGIAYLTNAYRNNQGKIKNLRNHYPQVKVQAVDNNHNNGGIWVTPEQAEQWDFTIDNETLNHMLVYVLNEIYQQQITGNQIKSAAGDVLDVKGADELGRQLMQEIARHLPNASK